MSDLSSVLLNNKASVAALVGAALLIHQQRKSTKHHQCDDSSDDEKLQREANHDLHRLAALAHGAAIDHAGTQGGQKKILVVKNDGFNLDKTIFASVDSALNRAMLKTKLGNTYYWSDDAVASVLAHFEKSPAGLALRPPPGPEAPLPDPKAAALFDFMEQHCDFKCEHADGSFLDHLFFCRDYSAVHYPGHSPQVLFLHSICGVATNLFPMPPPKLPLLQGLLSPDEFTHVQAFPSVLRLLYHQELLKTLQEARAAGRLGKLKAVHFHRVMDDAPLSLTADEFWVHMNYQVMHLLDFLPCCFWQSQLNDPMFGIFIEVHELMVGTGKLEAKLGFEVTNPADQEDGLPMSLGRLVAKYVPSSVQRNLAAKSIRRWSAAKGHSLKFELEFS